MKIIKSIIFLSAISLITHAQEFDKQITNAKSTYEAGNYEESRNAVLSALHEIDMHIGRQVLEVLPGKINTMEYVPGADKITGSGSTQVGLFIERTWGEPGAENLGLSVISDSPLISVVNTFLNLPTILTGSTNQKKIKVEGYRAMLEKKVDENSNPTGYSLMLPYSDVLLQLSFNGNVSEDNFMAMVKQVPIAKVIELSK